MCNAITGIEVKKGGYKKAPYLSRICSKGGLSYKTARRRRKILRFSSVLLGGKHVKNVFKRFGAPQALNFCTACSVFLNLLRVHLRRRFLLVMLQIFDGFLRIFCRERYGASSGFHHVLAHSRNVLERFWNHYKAVGCV